MQRFKRSDRVASLIQRELSVIIDREIRDDRLGMITVTGVEMSRDLKYARAFISVLGPESSVEPTLEALNSAVPYIKSLLADRVRLRYLPELSFHYDSSTVDGMKMDALLERLNSDTDN
mgnify:CR=1 FL=1